MAELNNDEILNTEGEVQEEEIAEQPAAEGEDLSKKRIPYPRFKQEIEKRKTAEAKVKKAEEAFDELSNRSTQTLGFALRDPDGFRSYMKSQGVDVPIQAGRQVQKEAEAIQKELSGVEEGAEIPKALQNKMATLEQKVTQLTNAAKSHEDAIKWIYQDNQGYRYEGKKQQLIREKLGDNSPKEIKVIEANAEKIQAIEKIPIEDAMVKAIKEYEESVDDRLKRQSEKQQQREYERSGQPKPIPEIADFMKRKPKTREEAVANWDIGTEIVNKSLGR